MWLYFSFIFLNNFLSNNLTFQLKIFLYSFLLLNQYVFKTLPTPKGTKVKTIHEELAKNLTVILRPVNADQLVVSRFLKHSRFFFEILIKSMTQYLIETERIKVISDFISLYFFFFFFSFVLSSVLCISSEKNVSMKTGMLLKC